MARGTAHGAAARRRPGHLPACTPRAGARPDAAGVAEGRATRPAPTRLAPHAAVTGDARAAAVRAGTGDSGGQCAGRALTTAGSVPPARAPARRPSADGRQTPPGDGRVTRVTLCATGHSSPTRAGRWSSTWRPARHATVTGAASVAVAPAPSGSGSRTAATPAAAGACAADAVAAVRSRAVRAAAGAGDGPLFGRAPRSRVIAGITWPVRSCSRPGRSARR